MFKKGQNIEVNKRFISMLALVVGGESIFFLPFVLPRVFRPTYLIIFQTSNSELGSIFFYYGMIAMVSYFLGGPLADKFSSRSLLSFALSLTALGGLYLSTFPSIQNMKYLYAFWGVSTILPFWAALIKATRVWGGDSLQGSAFGLLDGGRGLFAALIGTLGVIILTLLLPNDISNSTIEQRKNAFRMVIFFTTFFTFLASILVFIALPSKDESNSIYLQKINFNDIFPILKLPTVWLQAVIIVCAYIAYKITDDFSLFAKDVLQYNTVQSASIGTISLWMRPVVAISFGFLADKFNSSKLVTISFIFIIFGGSIFSSGLIEKDSIFLFFLSMIFCSIGVFALRGLYFSIMKEGNIPLPYTGTVVGIISIIGYTPDIFMGLVMGFFLDSSPGMLGHQHLFFFLSFFGGIGLLASLYYKTFCSLS